MSDPKDKYHNTSDRQQQDIAERYGYNDIIKRSVINLGKVSIIAWALFVLLRSDISEYSKKWTHKTERSRIQQGKDVVNEIMFELKRGMNNPPY